MMLVLYGIFPNLIFTQKRKYIYVPGGTYFHMLMINLVG